AAARTPRRQRFPRGGRGRGEPTHAAPLARGTQPGERGAVMMRRRIAVASLLLAAAVPVAGLRAQNGTIGGAITTAKNRVADVVVFLVPVSPATQTGAVAVEAEMDQRSLKFVPNVVVVSPGSTVAFTNSDRVMHNVF